MDDFVQVVKPVVGVLVLEVGAAGPHLVRELGDVLQPDRGVDELVHHLVKIVVMAGRVVLDRASFAVPSYRGAVTPRGELAGKDLRRLAEGLAALPDPFRPLVCLVAFPALAPVEILEIGAPPEQRLPARRVLEQPHTAAVTYAQLPSGVWATHIPASAPSSHASVLLWPKGSICHVPRGIAVSPKFFLRNWCPRVVWSTIST